MSMALALGVVGMLAASGFVRAFLPVAIALTTTALGTLLPILRDAGENRGAFGRAMIANGTIGELFPIIAISVFLSGRGTWAALALLLAFGAIAYVALPRRAAASPAPHHDRSCAADRRRRPRRRCGSRCSCWWRCC